MGRASASFLSHSDESVELSVLFCTHNAMTGEIRMIYFFMSTQVKKHSSELNMPAQNYFAPKVIDANEIIYTGDFTNVFGHFLTFYY